MTKAITYGTFNLFHEGRYYKESLGNMSSCLNELMKLAQGKEYEVCIWGAGNVGTHFGRQILHEMGISVDYYCDSNAALWGKEIIDGIKCFNPQEIREKKIICFVMVSVHFQEEICRQAQGMGIEKIATYSELCELKEKTYFPFRMNKQIAVYTCILDGYDKLKEPISVSEECDYYLISDEEPDHESVYKYIDSKKCVPEFISDNIRRNRYCKMNAHKLFPQYRYSIYCDGSIHLKRNVTEKIKSLKRTRVTALARGLWPSIYIEAMRAAEQFRDSKELLLKQAEKYWLEGMPEDFGTFACGVLIREHNNPICRKLMEDWWNEVERFSRKDQVSFPYVLWKNGYSMEDVDTINGNDVFDKTYLIVDKEHLKPRIVV